MRKLLTFFDNIVCYTILTLLLLFRVILKYVYITQYKIEKFLDTPNEKDYDYDKKSLPLTDIKRI